VSGGGEVVGGGKNGWGGGKMKKMSDMNGKWENKVPQIKRGLGLENMQNSRKLGRYVKNKGDWANR